ncbi:hypothetical protein ACQP1O_18370 [Nocardia sp. CA-151230]|uniref:hypothetical protein n=1 Tax=Nocardia sp. CA-151230 TaxID=3239982 RepID=UPI003D9001BD
MTITAIDPTKATGASLGIVTADDERLFARGRGDRRELEIVPPGESVLRLGHTSCSIASEHNPAIACLHCPARGSCP